AVGMVAEGHAAFVDALQIFVPLYIGEQLPVVAVAVGGLGDNGGAIRLSRLQCDPLLQQAVQRDDAILEVDDLADAEAGTLTTIVIKEAGAYRHTQLIGIADAVMT